MPSSFVQAQKPKASTSMPAAALQDDMAHRAACGLQHRVTEAVAGDVLFAVQQDEAHAVAAVRPQEAVGDVGHCKW